MTRPVCSVSKCILRNTYGCCTHTLDEEKPALSLEDFLSTLLQCKLGKDGDTMCLANYMKMPEH